jgi:threonine dehydrogenase-like Zn-dependent dehydrogenase
VVVEASGTQPGLDLAGKLVRAHGVLSILGYHQGGPRQVDVGMWNWKAIDVVNAHVRRRADLLESMRIGLELEAEGADRPRVPRQPPLRPSTKSTAPTPISATSRPASSRP